MNLDNLSVLELGSGPGFLARHLLETFPSATYVALDFSSAMHALAETTLERWQIECGSWSWISQLPTGVQSRPHSTPFFPCKLHELRHKRHAASFYRAVRTLPQTTGIFLMCDHFAGEGGVSDTPLYM